MISRTTLLLTVTLASAAQAQSWTVTGPKGGTGGGEVACTQGDATYSCNSSRTYTTQQGRIFESEWTQFADADSVTSTRNVLRPSGKSTGATFTRKR